MIISYRGYKINSRDVFHPGILRNTTAFAIMEEGIPYSEKHSTVIPPRENFPDGKFSDGKRSFLGEYRIARIVPQRSPLARISLMENSPEISGVFGGNIV
jgi:hypothetical protein